MATGQSTDIVYAYAIQPDATTAATGAFTALKRRSGSFTSSVADIDDGEQGSERLADAAGAGRKTHTASFEFSFRELVLDDMLQSAFASNFVTAGPNSVLSLGKAPVYMTFVVFTPHLEPARQYTQYVGCTVTSLGLTFPQDNFIGMTVEIGGTNKTYLATAPWTSLSQAADKIKIRTCSSLESMMVATTAAAPLAEVGSIVNTLDFNLANASEELFDVRQCDPKEINLGAATVTGNVNAYLDDESDQWHRDADESEQAKLQWEWKGETTTYRIDIPQATNKSPGADPSGTTVAVDLPWGAVSTSPTITKFLNP